MPANPLAPEVTIWTDGRRAGEVSRLLERMGSAVRPIGVGGSRSAEVAQLAQRLGVPWEDDFRRLLVDQPAAYLLIASAEGVAPSELYSAVAGGSVVLALEPLAATFDDLPARSRPMLGGVPGGEAARGAGGPAAAVAGDADGQDPTPPGPAAGGAGAGVGGIVFVPAFLRGPGWTSAAEPLEVVGAPRLVSVTSLGAGEGASLYARLHDGWATALSIAGLPESIDASLVGPLTTVPEDPRGATGHLGLHARVPSGAAVVMQLSDRAAGCERRLSIVADAGRLDAGDADYRLLSAGGQVVDQHSAEGPSPDAVELAALQWRRLLDRAGGAAAPRAADEFHVLACCLATFLSARTQQPENPAKLLALHRR